MNFDSKRIFLFIAFCMLVALIFLEFLTLIYWIQLPFEGGSSEIQGLLAFAAHLECQIFYAPNFLVSLLVIVILYSWLILLMKLLLKKSGIIKIKLAGRELKLLKTMKKSIDNEHLKLFTSNKFLAFSISFSMILSMLYVLYAYAPLIINNEKFIGIDIPNYIEFMKNIRKYGLYYAFSSLSDRTLSVLVLYATSALSNMPASLAVQFSPLWICPLVALATYFYLYNAGLNKPICALACLFSAFSFINTIGVLAAFLSNMIAWILILFFSGLLLKSLCLSSKFSGFAAACALVAVLFAHVYSWNLLVAVLLLFAFTHIFRVKSKPYIQNVKVIAAILTPSIIAEIIRSHILSKLFISTTAAVRICGAGLSPNHLFAFARHLDLAVNVHFKGLFASPPMLLLAAIGTLTILYNAWRKDFCDFMKCWLITPSLIFPFANHKIQARLLYFLPFHILAALGLLYLTLYTRKRFGQGIGKHLAFLMAILLILMNLNYGFNSMSKISN